MFDNLPDNVSHSDFDESESDQYVEHILDQLPEWIRDFAEDEATGIIQHNTVFDFEGSVIIERIKEVITGSLVEKYMDSFDRLFADYMSDYIPDRYRVKYNKFTDKLELHLRYTPDDSYFMVSVNCFEDRQGQSDDRHFVSIKGKSGDVRFEEREEFETDITGDLEQDALYFSSKLMQIVSRAESYYNKL